MTSAQTLVVAAIIRKVSNLPCNEILIAQRFGDAQENHQAKTGFSTSISEFGKTKWEFPGGKIEPGELPEDALVREIKEELDIEIRVGEPYLTVPYRNIKLLVFLADYVSGKVKNKGCRDSRWVSPGELKDFDFMPADIPVVKKLASGF
jgi:8-oxo-dGTP diphosphatase